jgi:hypothetical protein
MAGIQVHADGGHGEHGVADGEQLSPGPDTGGGPAPAREEGEPGGGGVRGGGSGVRVLYKEIPGVLFADIFPAIGRGGGRDVCILLEEAVLCF